MQIFIGHDSRQEEAFKITMASALRFNRLLEIRGIYLDVVVLAGLYSRPTSVDSSGQYFDVISNAPMSTSFALTRFLLPWLVSDAEIKHTKWVMFMDGDMLVRCDLDELDSLVDDKYAVMCVKHKVEHGTETKMDGKVQTEYPRKNWSSMMLWNLHHPAIQRLIIGTVNTVKGKKLHQFCWLNDEEIGELPSTWNHLVGLQPENKSAKIVHYTQGVPSIPGYADCEHATEWFELQRGRL